MTQKRNRKGWILSICAGTQFINSKFGSRLEQRRRFTEMLSELGIRRQPPGRIRDEKKMRCPLAMQSFQIADGLLAVLRIAAVNPPLFEKMPAFALRIIEYGGIATVHRDDQCAARCNFV